MNESQVMSPERLENRPSTFKMQKDSKFKKDEDNKGIFHSKLK